VYANASALKFRLLLLVLYHTVSIAGRLLRLLTRTPGLERGAA
jgi:hypothetical protein